MVIGALGVPVISFLYVYFILYVYVYVFIFIYFYFFKGRSASLWASASQGNKSLRDNGNLAVFL